MITSFTDWDKVPFLEHHGIPGQEKGKRRFQYEDGSLTPAGKIRYQGKSYEGATTASSGKNYQTKNKTEGSNSGQKNSSGGKETKKTESGGGSQPETTKKKGKETEEEYIKRRIQEAEDYKKSVADKQAEAAKADDKKKKKKGKKGSSKRKQKATSFVSNSRQSHQSKGVGTGTSGKYRKSTSEVENKIHAILSSSRRA